MKPGGALKAVWLTITESFRLVFVEPIREGWPKWREWPRGMPAIALITLIAYVLTGVAVIFAGQLRSVDVLVAADDLQIIPRAATPFLTVGMVWCFALVQTAAMHAHWALKLVGLVLTAVLVAMFGYFGAVGSPMGLWLSGSSMLGLVVLTIVRWRKDFAAWEFAVVCLLLLLGTQATLLLAGDGLRMGFDFRPTLLLALVTTLAILAMPALMVAGAALSQIAVTAAESISTVMREQAPRWLWTGFVAVAVAVPLADFAWQAWHGQAPTGRSLWIGTMIYLALLVGLSALYWRLARATPKGILAGELSESWARYLYPLAAGMFWILVIVVPGVIIGTVADFWGIGFMKPAANYLGGLMKWAGNAAVLRAVIGVVALVVAWRRARVGDVLGPTLCSAYAIGVLMDLANGLSGGTAPLSWGAQPISWLFAAAAVVSLGWLAARRKLSRVRVGALAVVLVLASLYPHRAILDEPTSALLGYSGVAAVLFGLIWRLLTDGEFTQKASKALPMATRVLLFCANSLFAVIALAYVALTRATGTQIDIQPIGDLGDSLLGTPLLAAAMLTAMVVALRPDPRAEPVPPTDYLADLEQAWDASRTVLRPPPASPLPVAGPAGTPGQPWQPPQQTWQPPQGEPWSQPGPPPQQTWQPPRGDWHP